MPLTEKKRRFCEEYVVDLNGSAAAIRAGYSERGSRQRAYEMLADPEVHAYVQELREAQAKRCEITADEVLKEIARVAFADPRKVMAWGPDGVRLRDSAELTDDEASLVAEVSETTSKDGGSLRLKTHDKIRALELLGKHLKLFTDKHELSGPGGAPLAAPTIIEEHV